MALVSLLILVILKQINQSKKDTYLSYFLLTFFASLGFHFSTAYAIFYPVIIIAYFILNKIKIRWQHYGEC